MSNSFPNYNLGMSERIWEQKNEKYGKYQSNSLIPNCNLGMRKQKFGNEIKGKRQKDNKKGYFKRKRL